MGHTGCQGAAGIMSDFSAAAILPHRLQGIITPGIQSGCGGAASHRGMYSVVPWPKCDHCVATTATRWPAYDSCWNMHGSTTTALQGDVAVKRRSAATHSCTVQR